jgi:hypothetical protein
MLSTNYCQLDAGFFRLLVRTHRRRPLATLAYLLIHSRPGVTADQVARHWQSLMKRRDKPTGEQLRCWQRTVDRTLLDLIQSRQIRKRGTGFHAITPKPVEGRPNIRFPIDFLCRKDFEPRQLLITLFLLASRQTIEGCDADVYGFSHRNIIKHCSVPGRGKAGQSQYVQGLYDNLVGMGAVEMIEAPTRRRRQNGQYTGLAALVTIDRDVLFGGSAEEHSGAPNTGLPAHQTVGCENRCLARRTPSVFQKTFNAHMARPGKSISGEAPEMRVGLAALALTLGGSRASQVEPTSPPETALRFTTDSPTPGETCEAQTSTRAFPEIESSPSAFQISGMTSRPPDTPREGVQSPETVRVPRAGLRRLLDQLSEQGERGRQLRVDTTVPKLRCHGPCCWPDESESVLADEARSEWGPIADSILRQLRESKRGVHA